MGCAKYRGLFSYRIGGDTVGVLYKIYLDSNKKTCTMCGCIMDPNSLNHICECCLDDMEEIDREEVINETLS